VNPTRTLSKLILMQAPHGKLYDREHISAKLQGTVASNQTYDHNN